MFGRKVKLEKAPSSTSFSSLSSFDNEQLRSPYNQLSYYDISRASPADFDEDIERRIDRWDASGGTWALLLKLKTAILQNQRRMAEDLLDTKVYPYGINIILTALLDSYYAVFFAIKYLEDRRSQFGDINFEEDDVSLQEGDIASWVPSICQKVFGAEREKQKGDWFFINEKKLLEAIKQFLQHNKRTRIFNSMNDFAKKNSYFSTAAHEKGVSFDGIVVEVKENAQSNMNVINKAINQCELKGLLFQYDHQIRTKGIKYFLGIDGSGFITDLRSLLTRGGEYITYNEADKISKKHGKPQENSGSAKVASRLDDLFKHSNFKVVNLEIAAAEQGKVLSNRNNANSVACSSSLFERENGAKSGKMVKSGVQQRL